MSFIISGRLIECASLLDTLQQFVQRQLTPTCVYKTLRNFFALQLFSCCKTLIRTLSSCIKVTTIYTTARDATDNVVVDVTFMKIIWKHSLLTNM